MQVPLFLLKLGHPFGLLYKVFLCLLIEILCKLYLHILSHSCALILKRYELLVQIIKLGNKGGLFLLQGIALNSRGFEVFASFLPLCSKVALDGVIVALLQSKLEHRHRYVLVDFMDIEHSLIGDPDVELALDAFVTRRWRHKLIMLLVQEIDNVGGKLLKVKAEVLLLPQYVKICL